jgi:hypothetical protein
VVSQVEHASCSSETHRRGRGSRCGKVRSGVVRFAKDQALDLSRNDGG